MAKVKTKVHNDFGIFKTEIGEVLGCFYKCTNSKDEVFLIIGLDDGRIISQKIEDCEYII